MTRLPISAHGQNERSTIAGDHLAMMSSDTLLVAADALRAWGAEIDSEEIELWVAHRPMRQQVHQHNPLAER